MHVLCEGRCFTVYGKIRLIHTACTDDTTSQECKCSFLSPPTKPLPRCIASLMAYRESRPTTHTLPPLCIGRFAGSSIPSVVMGRLDLYDLNSLWAGRTGPHDTNPVFGRDTTGLHPRLDPT